MKCSKIIIFSDIHADLSAVQAIRDYMEKEDISVALNLGDFISRGENPCEVFDVLEKDKRFVNIMGYDEEELLDKAKRVQLTKEKKQLINLLGVERLEKLSRLSAVRKIEINKFNILMCHHNGWAELMQGKSHADAYINEKYSLIAYGGSHLQELCHSKGMFFNTMIMDPGEMHLNEQNTGKFAVVDLTCKEPSVSFCSIQGSPVSKEEITVQPEVEENIIEKQTFLYIHGKKNNENKMMYIEREVVEEVIRIGLKECKYVSIGCWRNEKALIKELLYYLKCRTIIYSEKDEQEWYMGEVTKEVEQFLLHHRERPDGRLKWFEISFLDQLDKDATQYSIYHYGQESFLKRLNMTDLYNIEVMLKKYNLSYHLPKDQEK